MDQEKTVRLVVGCLGTLVTFVIVAGALAWGMRPFYMPYVKALMWDGSETFVCEFNEDISMSNKTADISDGPALDVRGNCHVACENCKLKGEVGIKTENNAGIRLEGGSVEGTETGLDLGGNTRLEAKDVTIKGEVAIHVGGNASAVVRGGEVTGSKLLAKQEANGKVEFKKSKTSGAVEASRESNVTGL